MKNSELEDARQEVIEAACEWVTNIDFYESDLLRALARISHNGGSERAVGRVCETPR
jgi:hypothetical protein